MPEKDSPQIPDKLYYRIGEVSSLAGVAASVLRFWESEFPQIRPKRTPSGQRLYRRKDVETILTVKHLLYQEKFTIPGARKHLKSSDRKKGAPVTLDEIRTELEAIRKLTE